MTHDDVVKDLNRAAKRGALNVPPKLLENEVALFCRRLAQSTAIDADNLLVFAEDILANEGGQDRALMLLDGMRAGIQQAREAKASGRVVTVWFDNNGARATFSWSGDDAPNPELHQAIAQALNSALKQNGEADADPGQ